MATISLLKSKVHRATVTQADVHYVGSLSLDEDLMNAAGLVENERIDVADINNGERLTTYVIPAPRGSGVICMNGAAAMKVGVGDLVIIFAYSDMTPEEARDHEPKLVFVDGENRIVDLKAAEKHGTIA